MSLMADLLSTLFERRYAAAETRDDRPMRQLAQDLLTSRGEVSGMALARQILDRYAARTDDRKRSFFEYLGRELDIDADAMRSALEAYGADPSKRNYGRLMAASEPRRQELARRLNQVPGATGRLVEMRADLLRLAGDDPALARVESDLRHLFASWFNRGFLVLRPINWESPAHILDKIIAYEAVHAIHSWDDLRRRLRPADRRCFGFFHPVMPDEPLIFVQVALTRGIPGSIQGLLAEERPELKPGEADTAVFYSISNCQAGLAGISFGNSLIKQVVEDLSRELPQLKSFVTLSPIPGLMRWVESEGLGDRAGSPETLRLLAAHYLINAKRREEKPLDPVARFHLNNGAFIHNIHPMGDLSPNGLTQSGGAMVNYLYDLKRISKNHEDFANNNKVVAAKEILNLARAPLPAPQLRTGTDA
ncbi:malonyl-CoA decarboxylase domain-containing protein [Rhodobacteraceae bacterium DSL-40]|uniref:malonyl-CoA decarboxylase domain-containing protein n=1 Tax=Amaricoccus sp. B4 TaxID=3368557 RepID=UPI000DAE838D